MLQSTERSLYYQKRVVAFINRCGYPALGACEQQVAKGGCVDDMMIRNAV